MLARSPQNENSRKHYRLRVESCVDTILQLDKSLGKGKIRQDIIERFERLKESLGNVPDESIGEDDISRIEEATNELLSEIRISSGGEVARPFHDGQKH